MYKFFVKFLGQIDKNAILNGDWNVIEEAARQFSNIAALYNKIINNTL